MAKPHKTLFRRLLRNEGWSARSLSRLYGRELEALSLLLGIAKSGTIAKKASRLWFAYKLRQVLSRYDDDPNILAADFRAKELRYLAKTVGTYCWLNKRGIAASLLNWRNRCRLRGQLAYEDAMAELNKCPKQLGLFV